MSEATLISSAVMVDIFLSSLFTVSKAAVAVKLNWTVWRNVIFSQTEHSYSSIKLADRHPMTNWISLATIRISSDPRERCLHRQGQNQISRQHTRRCNFIELNTWVKLSTRAKIILCLWSGGLYLWLGWVTSHLYFWESPKRTGLYIIRSAIATSVYYV